MTRETSAAVPQRVVEAEERSLAELDRETRAHIAEVIARWWSRTATFGAFCFVVPIGGCTILSQTPLMSPAVVAGAWILLFASFPVQLVLRGIARRAVRDDVKLLGYDATAQEVAIKAWTHVDERTTLPHLTQASRARAIEGALDQLVRVAADKGKDKAP